MAISRRSLGVHRLLAVVLLLISAAGARAGGEVLIKNITTVEGEHINQLVGVGLVTGLSGTGGETPLTRELALNMLQRFGIRADPALRAALRNDTRQKTDNVSAVMVTAELRTTDQVSSTIDVTVSALDDAESLQGGTLIPTPLGGADGEVYAVAAGQVSIGGFSFSGDAASVQKNHTTTGKCQAIVEKRVPGCQNTEPYIRFLLRDPDYSTATRINDAVNQHFPHAARTLDSGTVHVDIPAKHLQDRHRFIGMIQQLTVVPDVRARVVINERTGTVVIGDNVRLSPVAVTHANLSVITGESPEASQPLPFSDGETVVVPRTEIDVVEENNPVTVIDGTATVGDLAQALNVLGVTPRDLSSIFRQLRELGALHAELIFN